MKIGLIQKIESLPEDFHREVEHFVEFLKTKSSEETVTIKKRKQALQKVCL